MNYSFIIPHKNSPNLLKRCLDSIPVRDDIQIIVVDDNSDEDKKPQINRKDVEVVLLDAVHCKGAGHARNVGIENAKGKWILFADSDDLYKENFLEVLDEYKDDKFDVLYFNIDSVNSLTLKNLTGSKNDRAQRTRKTIDNYSQSNKDTLLFRSYGPWNKMISRSFIIEYGLFFEEVYKGNDVLFSLELGTFLRSYKVEKRILYSLSLNLNSLTYERTTSIKYKSYINGRLYKAYFNVYIGHPEWNYTKNLPFLEPLIYVCGRLIKEPKIGVKVGLYFLSHLFPIYSNRKYYIDVIEELKKSAHKRLKFV